MKAVLGMLLWMPVLGMAQEFTLPTLEEARTAYQEADKAFDHEKGDPSFVAFASMLADGWVAAHKQQALDKAMKRHEMQASMDDVWPLPLANDWLGCMMLQFPDKSAMTKANFASYAEHPMLLGWIDQHQEELNAAEQQDFVQRLKKLPDWAPRCEKVISALDGVSTEEGIDV